MPIAIRFGVLPKFEARVVAIAGIGMSMIGAGVSCSSTPYSYVPAEQQVVSAEVDRSVGYVIPSGDRKGRLRIKSHGVVEIRPKEEQAGVRTLHLRMELENSGTEPWVLNSREQILELPEHGESRPAYLNTDAELRVLPMIVVNPGIRRTVDLFYPLPAGIDQASEIPGFAFNWRMQVPEQVVKSVVNFDRVGITAESESIDLGRQSAGRLPYEFGEWPSWWYDPLYPDFSFDGPLNSALRGG